MAGCTTLLFHDGLASQSVNLFSQKGVDTKIGLPPVRRGCPYNDCGVEGRVPLQWPWRGSPKKGGMPFQWPLTRKRNTKKHTHTHTQRTDRYLKDDGRGELQNHSSIDQFYCVLVFFKFDYLSQREKWNSKTERKSVLENATHLTLTQRLRKIVSASSLEKTKSPKIIGFYHGTQSSKNRIFTAGTRKNNVIF